MQPREVVEHLQRLGVTGSKLDRARRDAKIYELMSRGWKAQEVAPLFDLDERYTRKRFTAFAALLRQTKKAAG